MDFVSTNVTSAVSINSVDKKKDKKWVLYFAYSFISNRVTIHNTYHLLHYAKHR